MSRFRNVCFTVNNWNDNDKKIMEHKKVKYCVIGEEVGENKTPHLQGYVEFDGQLSLKQLKEILPRAHFENRKGTAKQAADYCKKDGKFSEVGQISDQGKRTDIERMMDMVKEKKSDLEIMCEIPNMCRDKKALDNFRYAVQQNRTEKPKVYWRWGLAGVGKTRFVIDTHGMDNVYIKDGTQWWNGYCQQDVILIDDFDGKWPFRDLLRLLDRYSYQGQTKGGYVKINSPTIYITCEFAPHHYWKENELAQILRRIDDVSEICSEVGYSEVSGNTKPTLSTFEYFGNNPLEVKNQ